MEKKAKTIITQRCGFLRNDGRKCKNISIGYCYRHIEKVSQEKKEKSKSILDRLFGRKT